MTADDHAHPGAGVSEGRLALLMKNAGANLVRAVATSAMTVLLPLALVALFDGQHYAAWALVFSIGAYVVYLDLGIPTTIQAMVGRALGADDRRTARRVTFSGLTIVGGIATLCLLVAISVSGGFSIFFPDIPRALISQAGTALPIIVGGQVSVLLGNVAAAYFGGQQRSHVPMLVLTPARLLCMLSAVTLAFATGRLDLTAWGFAVPLIMGAAVLIVFFLRDSRGASGVEHPPTERSGIVAVLTSSGPLMIWGVCALLTTGVGVAIVARFDYGAVVAYSIATIFVSALAGAQSSLTTPWLPEFGRDFTMRGPTRVAAQVVRVSAVNAVFLCAIVAVLVVIAPWALPLLTRHAQADLVSDWSIFAILLTGSAIHLIATPLTLAFIATRSHTKIIAPPVIEAAISLVLSLVLGQRMGAIGVAIAALVAGIVGVVLCFAWSIRLSGVLVISRVSLFVPSLVLPLAALVPALAAAIVTVSFGLNSTWGGAAVALMGGAMSLWILIGYALPASVRARVLSRMKPVVQR